MQNIEQIQRTKRRLETSAFVLFMQYSDYNISEWRVIKKELLAKGLRLKVIKKRVVLKKV